MRGEGKTKIRTSGEKGSVTPSPNSLKERLHIHFKKTQVKKGSAWSGSSEREKGEVFGRARTRESAPREQTRVRASGGKGTEKERIPLPKNEKKNEIDFEGPFLEKILIGDLLCRTCKKKGSKRFGPKKKRFF